MYEYLAKVDETRYPQGAYDMKGVFHGLTPTATIPHITEVSCEETARVRDKIEESLAD